MTTHLHFDLVELGSREIVLHWLQKPHVREFFYGQGLQNTLDDLDKFVEGRSSVFQHWMASNDGVPFGYLMTSPVNPQEDLLFAKYMESGETAITLDLLIGEEAYLGRGLGAEMIRAFLRDRFSHVAKVFIDPALANPKAIHVYEKAGFRPLEIFTPEWDPTPHQLMVLTY